jgi:hypothetical protein
MKLANSAIKLLLVGLILFFGGLVINGFMNKREGYTLDESDDAKVERPRDTNDVLLEEEFYGVTEEEDEDGVITTKQDPLQKDLYS